MQAYLNCYQITITCLILCLSILNYIEANQIKFLKLKKCVDNTNLNFSLPGGLIVINNW